MSGVVGADIEQVWLLSRKFSASSRKLSQLMETSNRGLKVVEWVGADIDKLRSEWDSQTRPSILRSVTALKELSDHLHEQAKQQYDASKAVSSLADRPGVLDSMRIAAPPAPSSSSDYWKTLREMKHNDGIRIQKILCDDGEIRYVVYINGTDSATNGTFSKGDNVLAEATMGSKTEDAILAEMKKRIIPPNAEVRIDGYSQGGIHAQNIAAESDFNVKDVRTYGSPYTRGFNDINGPHIVRFQDINDLIPYFGSINQAPSNIGTLLEVARRGFFGDPNPVKSTVLNRLNGSDVPFVTNYDKYDSIGMDAHTDFDTYSTAADKFDVAGTNLSGIQKEIDRQSKFNGVVLEDFD